ncbi:MAG: thioredoxin domain-containing protein [Spirochaetales bacterium]|nr:thioredoxin domain-containing protein [Spirochaetales bacterium]
MKIIRYTILISLVVFASIQCTPDRLDNAEVSAANEEDFLMAEIGNSMIYMKDIDALIRYQIDELRIQTLDRYISKTLLEKEAVSRGISVEDLVSREILNKTVPVSTEDVSLYKSQMEISDNTSFYSKDDKEIAEYLAFIRQKEREFVFVNELKKKFNTIVHYRAARESGLSENLILNHPIGMQNSDISIYVVFDYDCPACNAQKEAIDLLISQYQSKATFNFVYYGATVSDKALCAEAAALQGKYWLFKRVIAGMPESAKLADILPIAKDIGMDMEKFKADVSSNALRSRIEESLDTIALLGVKSVPTYVINGNILHDSSAKTLENELKRLLL